MKYQNSQSIKFWAEQDRPRERMLVQGPKHLTNAELLTILLGSGNKQNSADQLSQIILGRFNHDLHLLSKTSPPTLTKLNGIGRAKAVLILAALELGKRSTQAKSQTEKKILSSQDAFEQLKLDLFDLNHEEFHILFLNKANFVLHKSKISSGGITSTVVDARMIFKVALEHNATSIILAHNHPSGTLKPSHADKSLTQEISKAGQTMNITVLDHLIISKHGYLSFADEGLL